MKVKELIEKLEALDDEAKDLTVITEGCDCFGDVDMLVQRDNWGEDGSDAILLTRPEFHDAWVDLVAKKQKEIEDNGPLQLP